MLGPRSCNTEQDFWEIALRSVADRAPAFGISRSMMYFGIAGSGRGWWCLVSHCGDIYRVLAGDGGIPARKNTNWFVLPHPGVQPPELKGVVLQEWLVEKHRRVGVTRMETIRDDVLDRYQ